MRRKTSALAEDKEANRINNLCTHSMPHLSIWPLYRHAAGRPLLGIRKSKPWQSSLPAHFSCNKRTHACPWEETQICECKMTDLWSHLALALSHYDDDDDDDNCGNCCSISTCCCCMFRDDRTLQYSTVSETPESKVRPSSPAK